MKVPRHLQPETRCWLRQIMGDFMLESHHIRLLVLAGEAWDRCNQARFVVEEKGLTYEDRFGQPCARPEVAIERDSRFAFARLLKQLELDVEPPRPEPGRPPRAAGGY
jgi:hypothetical protein